MPEKNPSDEVKRPDPNIPPDLSPSAKDDLVELIDEELGGH